MIVLMSVKPGEDEQQQERRRQRRDRQHDRDQHRDEGAEDDEQHDDRRQQAEALLRPLLDRWELSLAVVLDGHADRLDGLAHGVLDCDDLLAVRRLDRLVELDFHVGDAAVVGERVLAERIADARHARLAVRGLELRGLEAPDRPLDRRFAIGCVEPLTGRRGEHHVQHGALLGRELRLDQVGRFLRLGAGDLELVSQRATDGHDQDDQQDDEPDPAEDDAPGMCGAGASPARKRARRESFVGRAPLGIRVLRHGLLTPSSVGST